MKSLITSKNLAGALLLLLLDPILWGQSNTSEIFETKSLFKEWISTEKIESKESSDWGTVSGIASSLSTVSGLTLPSSTKEAGMVLELAPGNYTFVLKSKTAVLSGAMIEAYEAD